MSGSCNGLFRLNPFPRVNWPLCPQVLAPYLQYPPPDGLNRDGYSPAYLCDLDAEFWRFGTPEQAQLCIAAMERRLAENGYRLLMELGQDSLESLVRANGPGQIVVSERTYQVLQANGILSLTGLLRIRFERILRLRGFDPHALLDLTVALERYGMWSDWQGGIREGFASIAREVRDAVSHSSGRLLRDPRFADRFVGLKPKCCFHGPVELVIDELPERAGSMGASQIAACHEVLDQLLADIGTCYECTIAEELTEIVASVASSNRNVEAVVMQLGLNGTEPMTLEAVGKALGVTRERVRQIVGRTRKALDDRVYYTPRLDAALEAVAQAAPASEEEVQKLLSSLGLAERRYGLKSLYSAARLMRRAPEFGLETVANEIFAVPPNWTGENENPRVRDLMHLAMRLTDSHGAVQVDDFLLRAEDKYGTNLQRDEAISLIDDFPKAEWLDPEREWFWISNRVGPRNRLINLIRKAMCVAHELTSTELRNAVRRHRRLGGSVPPSTVVEEICSRLDWLIVDGQRIRDVGDLDWRTCLSGVELEVVRILDELGPAMRIQDLWPVAQAGGMSHVRFFQVVSDSPAIVRHAKSVYGLRGRPVTALELYELAEHAREGRSRILQEHGRLEDGAYWLRYRISTNTLRLGQVTLPQMYRREVEGDRVLRDMQGNSLGAVRFESTRIVGLSRGLRALGAEDGDSFMLVVSPAEAEAMAVIGDDETVSEFLEGLVGARQVSREWAD